MEKKKSVHSTKRKTKTKRQEQKRQTQKDIQDENRGREDSYIRVCKELQKRGSNRLNL